uniref:Uncharacterized protein n=1 Tax=Anguilla anguilla TaxID=7936 RepID=A0A0E9R537_ANGAN
MSLPCVFPLASQCTSELGALHW